MLLVQPIPSAQTAIPDLANSESSQQSLSLTFATKNQLSPKMHELLIKYEAEKACRVSRAENNI